MRSCMRDLVFMPSPTGLDTKKTRGSNSFHKVFFLGLGKIYLLRFSRFDVFSRKVAKCEKDNELLKIRNDIRRGGSFLCAITAPRRNARVCDAHK